MAVTPTILDVEWVIAKCGGARAISDFFEIHVDTCFKWRKVGIHDRYWAGLMFLGEDEFDERDLYRINEALRIKQGKALRYGEQKGERKRKATAGAPKGRRQPQRAKR